ncbi:MAG TPA: GFA family protein [Candidatus Contendobacter sp.]|nr:GFA family protein [Candidatus Contendobacter sp.]HRD50319.1 GFA family protein [Candidatus Contendobacter sp.]
MKNYKGGCHCGSVSFSYEGEEIISGLRCNCSFCSRRGAMMSPEAIAPERFKIEAAEGALGLYQFGVKTAKHYFCKKCGIYPFHETARKPGYFRVNLGCVEGVDPFLLEFEVFDGKRLL